MEQSPFSEAERFSASQETVRILWYPKVNYRIHNSTPPAPVQSETNPVLAHPTSLKSILILFSHLLLGLPSVLFHSGFLAKTLYARHLFPMRATCPAHQVLLDLVIRVFSEECSSKEKYIYFINYFLLDVMWKDRRDVETHLNFKGGMVTDRKAHTTNASYSSIKVRYVILRRRMAFTVQSRSGPKKNRNTLVRLQTHVTPITHHTHNNLPRTLISIIFSCLERRC